MELFDVTLLSCYCYTVNHLFFREHKIFARIASGIKFANSFFPEVCGLKHVFLQTGFVSFFQDPKSAEIFCNEKSKTEKSRNFTATNTVNHLIFSIFTVCTGVHYATTCILCFVLSGWFYAANAGP